MDQQSSSTNEKASANVEEELTVPNEVVASGTKTLPVDPQPGKRKRDIDQTAAATKRPRYAAESQGEFENLKHGLRIANPEVEHFKKNEEFMSQRTERDAKSKEKLQNDCSSLLSRSASENRMIYSLSNSLLKVKDENAELKRENAELKRENENLKNIMTEKQLDFHTNQFLNADGRKSGGNA